MAGNRVLVTGGCGYIGRLAVAALRERDVPVVSLDVREPPADGRVAGVDYRTADVRDPGLGRLLIELEVGSVVHLAAVLEAPAGVDAAALHDIEVGGTRNVVDACRQAGVGHLVVTSSGAAYGYEPSNEGRWLSEDDPLHGSERFLYSRHKREVEELLAQARAEDPSLRVLVLRPGTVLGSGTRNAITRLFDAPVVLGLRGTEIPFVLVWDHDVAEVIVRGVCERRSGTYNLAGDGVVTMRDIADAQGKRYVALPPALVAGALRVLRAARLAPYGPEQVDFLRYRPVLANTRLRADFPGLPRLDSREVLALFLRARAAAAAAAAAS